MAEHRALDPLLSYVIDEALALVEAERGYVVLSRPDGTLDFRVLRDNDGHAGHIFNLGHGVQPDTDPGVLHAVVDLVHEETGRT